MAYNDKPGQSKDEQIEALRLQLAQLQTALADSKIVAAELSSRAAYFAGRNEEVPSGRTTTVMRCKNPWEKKEEKQKWEEVEVPTFLYTIDMKPVGGTDLKLDGIEKYHGQTYEMTLDTLRTVKEIVFRLDAHEASIHGDDEDVFRPRISTQISLKTGQMRALPPNWLPGMPT